MDFGRFNEVYVSDDSVHLRGPSFLATDDFKIEDVQLVYLRGDHIKELVFLWYDRTIQSTYIASFDRQSSTNLQKMIELLAGRGVVVHPRKPEDDRHLSPFRPWK